ncbi:hypothetical protein MTX78_06640 [Hymenobacter tibetensis]|uniref:Beta-lactamase-related domain-containing protein n=1 Tax=Hymenobacter tibetensis TaxID=497967 RepID=A0ABY4D535_9BACT|nr:hypothetical protein [Hymenobacter tibetensis]UOG76271.1 hypothetical protein MTX78_06640 [Hymenobacter tibetensis]
MPAYNSGHFMMNWTVALNNFLALLPAETSSRKASHGCSIIMQNGQLIAAYFNDWWMSRYEGPNE